MLINTNAVTQRNEISDLISMISGRSPEATQVAKGVYEIGHFGDSMFPGPGFEQYPEDLGISPYGVCDNYQDILNHCPALEDSIREFVITLTKIEKAQEPEEDGWRWHKWGPYIGTQEPTAEYIYDEPIIDTVYVYHIYEKIG